MAIKERTRRQIFRARGGIDEHMIFVDEIQVPDMWHLAMALRNGGLGIRSKESRLKAADMILEVWHLAHDLRRALQEDG